jgi:hypothetical protein
LNSNFKELFAALNEAKVDYLVIGGYAVIFHSRPRFTKDLDIWLRPSPENARKLMRAFGEFGLALIGIEESDFSRKGTQYQIGRPPVAIDFLTSVGDLEFEECQENRVLDEIDGIPIPYLGKSDLIRAKQIAGRLEDLADIRNLTMLDDEE